MEKLGKPVLSGTFNRKTITNFFNKIIATFLVSTSIFKKQLGGSSMIGPIPSALQFTDNIEKYTIYVIPSGSPDKQWKRKQGYEIRILFTRDMGDNGAWLNCDLCLLTDVIEL